MTTTKASKSGQRTQPSALTSGGKKQRGGKKGRKPVAPVKVGKDRNWGPILMFGAVGVIAALIIGWAFWQSWGVRDGGAPWLERAAEIEEIVAYDVADPMLSPEHVNGPLQYEVQPPVGGPHNDLWQNCTGMVYDDPIASEHAVHSLEHGAVWITHDPALPADQVEELRRFVDGVDFTMMSPFPGLDAPISLQAWGYQLKVDDAGDERIGEFIRALRTNTGPEAGQATCGGPNSVSTTGTTPVR